MTRSDGQNEDRGCGFYAYVVVAVATTTIIAESMEKAVEDMSRALQLMKVGLESGASAQPDGAEDPELSRLVRDVPDRFQGKHVFLTYAKCNLSKEEFVAKFEERLPEKSRYFGGRTEKGGVPHFHVLVGMKEMFRPRAKKQFDLVGEPDEGGHPHWQYAEDLFAVQEYCGKEHDVFGEKIVEDVPVGKKRLFGRAGDAQAHQAQVELETKVKVMEKQRLERIENLLQLITQEVNDAKGPAEEGT